MEDCKHHGKHHHPSKEHAKEKGHYHIDSGKYDHVKAEPKSEEKISKSDSDNAAEDFKAHELWGHQLLDEEALETGYGTLQLCVPIIAPGINRKSAAAIVATFMLVDNSMYDKEDYKPETRQAYGKTVREHAVDMVSGVGDQEYTDYIAGAVELNHIRQYETIRARRKIQDHSVPETMESFIQWRNYEGQFYGTLVVALAVAGIDVRKVPPKAIEDTIAAGIFNYDAHGHYRHSSEHEFGDAILHLKGSFPDRIRQALRIVRTHYDAIVECKETSDRVKEVLTRYILSAEMNYLTERYWRHSSLTVGVHCKDNSLWTHTKLSDAGGVFTRHHAKMEYHHED